jgi:3'-5' exonuclease
MLEDVKPEQILFLDIETVPQYDSFERLRENWKALWLHKVSTLRDTENQNHEDLYRRAGIFAEFGKIICISIGTMSIDFNEPTIQLQSFSGDDEKELLTKFCNLLNSHPKKNILILCAHNGKEFDFPYLSRRCIINGIKLPAALDNAGKKPWEIKHLDTLELWKFGDYKSYSSLNLLATVLNIPTPKDDINGSEVCNVYYKEKNLARIVTYCQKDTLTVAQIFMRYKGLPLIKEEHISII